MVEQFNRRTVEDSGQTPGYLQVNYSPDAFGAQVGRALGNLGQNTQRLGQVIAQVDRTKKVNDVQNVVNRAKESVRPSFFDPQWGVYAQRGGNAMGTGATARAVMQNAKDTYIKELEDPQMQELFTKLWDNETESALDRTAAHEMRELGDYQVQTAKSTLAQSITDAYNFYNDDKAIEKAVLDAESIIQANQMGLDPTSLAAAKSEARSQITLAAISRWATEDPYKALDFYERNKESLSGKDHIVAGQLVNAARDARFAEEDIARITGSGGLAAGQLWNNLIQAESSGNNMAVSEDGALGVAQVMPDTARYMLAKMGMETEASLDDESIKRLLQSNQTLAESLGKGYLQEQLEAFDGDVEAALVAYNAGPERAKKFLEFNVGRQPGNRDYNVPGMDFLAKETQPYVNKILGARGTSSTPEGYRLTDSNWNLRNFQPDDLMAPTPGGRWVDARAAQGLDSLADVMKQRFPGLEVKINERGNTGGTQGKRRGTSDPKDNPHVAQSQHLKGRAFDIQVQGWSDEQKAAFIVEARKLGFAGFGFYGPNGHLHIDMGANRTWGRVPEWAREAIKTPVTAGPGTGLASASNPVSELPASGTGLFGIGAQAPGGAFVSTKSPDLNRWLAMADQIPDPGRRARAKEGLRLQAAQWEQDAKAQKGALQQQVWEQITSGGSVRDLKADLLAQLAPEFVSQLNTFETNRAKKQMPMDWQAWASVPTDPHELSRIDPYTEYRNKLDDEHFDRLLTMWRESQNKVSGRQADESLLANARTSRDIISDTIAAVGWTAKSNPEEIANFNSKMDQRILAAQQAKGQRLDATEIQDIADKLLIEGETRGTLWNSNTRAIDAKNPQDFIAAGAWDEVQEDDQRTLVDTYTRYFSEPPDQEVATDLYNRAMRVWLGGNPEGPEDETEFFRSGLENRLNRVLTQTEFEKYYGQWLLTFLTGRSR